MSPAFSLNAADFKKWGTNLAIFFIPVALIYLVAVITSVNNTGVSFAAFVPDKTTTGAMVLYVLNAFVDILRKFQAGTTATQ